MKLPGVPSFDLTGQRFLVTGGGRGIGLGAGVALAANGAHVVLAARSTGEVSEAAEAMQAEGWSAEGVSLDIADQEAVGAFLQAQDPFDGLVNNAGAANNVPFHDQTEADFDLMVSINVKALYFLTQAVTKRMIETGRTGAIVNISSQMGHIGGEKRTIYCGTKHAVEGMTKAMALELAPHRIRVNSVGPTFVHTALTEKPLQDPAFRRWVLDRIPMGRVAEIDEISGAILFLCSPAAAMVTGTSLLVDGGWTAR